MGNAARAADSGCVRVAGRPVVSGSAPLLLRGFSGRRQTLGLGPYNEHLISDVGAGYLALGVMLAAAGIFLGRTLVRVALIAWLTFALPHFAFHLTTRETFSLADNLASLGGLGLVVLLPLVLLAFTGRIQQPQGGRRWRE